MKRVAQPDAAEEIAEELIPLARSRVGGSGSSESAARARPLRRAREGMGRRGRGLGPARDAVPRPRPRGRDPGRRSPTKSDAAGRLRNSRVHRVQPARPAGSRPGRVPRGARLAPGRDRRLGRAREDDDDRDDRLRARPARARPVVPDRRRDPAARRQRAGGRAGSSWRATSPTGRSSCCGRRSRSSRTSISTITRVRVARRGRGVVRARGSPRCRTSFAPTSSSRSTCELAVPGEHNRLNAAAALAALELAGVDREEAWRRSGRVPRRGPSPRAPRRGRRRARARRLRAPSRRDPRHDRGGAQQTAMRVLVLFQPHLYSRTRHLAHELGAALATADVVAVTEIYRARARSRSKA